MQKILIICRQCNKPRSGFNNKYNLCLSCSRHFRKQLKQQKAPLIKCQCDDPNCQELIPSITLNGKPQKFKHFHNNKGVNHPYYKCKITHDQLDYKYYRYFNHEKKDKQTIMNHRKIYENYYNCCLLKGIHIHHIDHNPANNDINNLMPLPANIHHTKKYRRSIEYYRNRRLKA